MPTVRRPALPRTRPTLDAVGDPLPNLAWARLGSSRLRHAGVVRSVRYSPDGRFLATAGDDKVVRIWAVGTWRAVHTLSAHSAAVSAIAFSPDGQRLASGGGNGETKVWNLATGAVAYTVSKHKRPVVNVEFSGDGKRLMSASADLVQVIRSDTGKPIASYRPGPAQSYSFALSRSGRFVLSARDKWMPGGRLDSWRVGSPRAYSSSGTKAWPRAVAVSPAGRTYAQLVRWQDSRDPSVVRGYRLYVRDARTNRILHIRTRRHRRGDPERLVFSPDGSRLIVARSGRLDVWNARTGRRLRTITVPFISATGLAVSADNRTVAVSSKRHHAVLLYNLATGARQPAPVGNPGPIVALDVSHYGDRVVVAHGDVESSAEWLVADSTRSRMYAGLVIGVRRGVRQVRYLGAETLVVSAHDNCLMQVWHRRSGRLVERVGCRPKAATPTLVRDLARKRIWVHGTSNVFGNVHGIERSRRPLPAKTSARSAARHASGDSAGMLTIFTAAHATSARKLLHRISVPGGAIHAVAFTRRGNVLAVASDDGSISLWRPDSGKRIATLRGHMGAVLSLQASDDGRLLFSGGRDATVLVWDLVAATRP